MPKQEWDVADSKKLRRVIGSHNDFETEDYYQYWVNPQSSYTNGGRSTLSTSFETITMATGVDRYGRHNLYQRDNWIKGAVTAKAFFVGDTYAGQDVELLQRVRHVAVGEAAPTLVLLDQQTITLPVVNLETFSMTSTSSEKERLDRVVMGYSCERLGANVNDTYAQDLNWLGTLITWKPTVGRP